MIKWILNWISGGLASSLTKAYEAKLNSKNESEKLRAEVVIEEIEAQMDARRQATEIRIATAGFWEMRAITFVIAACFALHLVLVTLDTCFSFGWRIAKFPAPFDEWQGTILLSFFGLQIGNKALNTAAFIFGKK